ncbi:MAG: succinate dehydrogenase assembly factor 2 [Ascidiaceihabitans sp.]|jgi:antitoxin CptB|tara:strand:+ start:8436 stop:8702 length:267 start_codon:yes stop_codon:yes gene_type:complete
MTELPEHRIKRLVMRSMRRGIKEMDIILSAYATENLVKMDETTITLYDRLLDENDQDLYQWVTGQVAAPERFRQMIAKISVQMQGIKA